MEPPAPSPSSPLPDPPSSFLASLYEHLPFLVVCLAGDGRVAHCNPEAGRLTGYGRELRGKHFWGTLFPGRLFAQVPRFISPEGVRAAPLRRDVPMTMRTRSGEERIVAFTRFGLAGSPEGGDFCVCVGIDLTDRLNDADKAGLPEPEAGGGVMPFGPQAGDGGAIEGEIVMPLAISPPAPQRPEGELDATGEAIREVHEFLATMDSRMQALKAAFEQREMEQLASLAQSLHTGAYACGLLKFSSSAERLQQAATSAQMAPLHRLVEEMLAMYESKDRA